ncbi:hypothetical protein SAY87_027113 [Trapa incisa]|uniref:Dof zinc finger protein n=1 Tax=Trapa incisa TaxID=236973 RepID=A0AAN7JLI7_9MYRT|nr:hypothetical protein SAY87_027113 [Trapa incisa]
MSLTSLQVCMDSAHWLEGSLIQDESGIDSSSSPSRGDMLACSGPLMERRLRPPHDLPLKCPRCESTHTKFCYYNNYSLSQPRYFCKTCRRYWTKGGTLRNIPVGGGCRKNRKASASSSKKQTEQDHHHNSGPMLMQTQLQLQGSSSSPALSNFSARNSTDIHLSLPRDYNHHMQQLSPQFGRLLVNGGGPPPFSSMDHFMEGRFGATIAGGPPMDFIMEGKLEAIVGSSNPSSCGGNNNYDFMGNNNPCSEQVQQLGLGVLMGDAANFGDLSMSSSFGPNFHGLCSSSPSYGAIPSPMDHPMVPHCGIGEANFMENNFYQNTATIDVKPNPKLLSLEWHDQNAWLHY